jgi:hypothetical protein
LLNVIERFLNLLGIPVENQHAKPGTEKASSSGISTIFDRDVARQKYDHLNKYRDPFGMGEHTNYLKDGTAGPPRR